MMPPSMETFSHYWPFHRWIPYTKASDAELWYIFDQRLNKRLSKQSWGWWFETLSRSLWRHCNVIAKCHARVCRVIWYSQTGVILGMGSADEPLPRVIPAKTSQQNKKRKSCASFVGTCCTHEVNIYTLQPSIRLPTTIYIYVCMLIYIYFCRYMHMYISITRRKFYNISCSKRPATPYNIIAFLAIYWSKFSVPVVMNLWASNWGLVINRLVSISYCSIFSLGLTVLPSLLATLFRQYAFFLWILLYEGDDWYV